MINKQDLEAIQICRTVAQIAIERGAVYPGLTTKVGMAIVRLRILIEQEAKRYAEKQHVAVSEEGKATK